MNPQDSTLAASLLAAIVLPDIADLGALESHTGLPRAALTAELESGRLKGRKVAGRWLVHRDEVRRWLCRRSQRSSIGPYGLGDEKDLQS